MVPDISPGCAANCLMAVSDSTVKISLNAFRMGVKMGGKMLRSTWKMSNDARMFERVSMGL